jgi:outer membrane autotransporter protein
MRVVALTLTAAGAPALAQTNPPPGSNGPLATLPGLTSLQQPTATAVNTLCVQFAPNGIIADRNGTGQQRLAYTCTAMVLTAAQQGGTNLGPSLGISNPELRKAVQDISPVQMGAQKQVTQETSRMNVIGARLLDLRQGATGVTVSSTDPQNTRTGNTQTAALQGGKGGGAAADTPLGGPLGGFLNVGYNWGKADQTDLQDAYDYKNWTVIGGLDYRVSPSMVLGAAIGYSETKSDFDGGLGDVKARTTSITGYGTYYLDQGWYLDGFVGYGDVRYDSVRNITIPSNNPAIAPFLTSAKASPKGEEWSASISIGRGFPYGTATITPSARLAYIHVKNKSFSEDEPNYGLGLAVNERTVESLQTALGGRASTVVNTAQGVFTPYASAYWVHEFKNDQVNIVSKYVNDPFNTFFAIPTANPTRDYGVLGIGSAATLPNNVSAFAQFTAAIALKDQTAYGIVLGVRKQF